MSISAERLRRLAPTAAKRAEHDSASQALRVTETYRCAHRSGADSHKASILHQYTKRADVRNKQDLSAHEDYVYLLKTCYKNHLPVCVKLKS